MGYADDLIKLRKRMLDAVTTNLVDDNFKNLYEGTLIQIMNESERQRQVCITRAEDLRRQAGIADGQAAAFAQISSIIYNVINGYILAAEKQQREEAARAEEDAEKEEAKKAALAILEGEKEPEKESNNALVLPTSDPNSTEISKKRRRK